MWQELRETVHAMGCEIVTVALDATGGARVGTFLDRANPQHPALVDQSHVVTRLFGIANIPSSIWIDESGIMVRPAEYAPRPPGSPIETGPLPDGVPRRIREIVEETSKIDHDGRRYHEALLDWIRRGADSRFALTPDEVVSRSRPRDREVALGHAHFELANHLETRGEHEAAIPHFREAHRLAPGNWVFRRQAWSLEPGLNRFWQGPIPDSEDAWPYDGDWLTDIRREGANNYYEGFRP